MMKQWFSPSAGHPVRREDSPREQERGRGGKRSPSELVCIEASPVDTDGGWVRAWGWDGSGWKRLGGGQRRNLCNTFNKD